MSVLTALIRRRGRVGPPTLGPAAKVIIDGNSYYAQWTPYPSIDQVGALASLLTSTGTDHGSSAVAGRTWSQLRQSTAARDALKSTVQSNTLVVGEHRNQISVRMLSVTETAQQLADNAIAEALAYVTEAKAAGFASVVMCGTIPTGRVEGNRPLLNAALGIVETWWRANWAVSGCSGYVDFRTHAPAYFDFDGNADQGFMASTATCLDNGAGAPDRVHPVGSARDAMADTIASVLTQMAG